MNSSFTKFLKLQLSWQSLQLLFYHYNCLLLKRNIFIYFFNNRKSYELFYYNKFNFSEFNFCNVFKASAILAEPLAPRPLLILVIIS